LSSFPWHSSEIITKNRMPNGGASSYESIIPYSGILQLLHGKGVYLIAMLTPNKRQNKST
jgi:hypothetical protein